MSKRDYCIHWVELSHLTPEQRGEAADWACELFGVDCVDITSPKEVPHDRHYAQLIPGFWFAHEKDAVFFSLRY